MIELLNHIGRLWWAWTASMFWQVGLLILLIGCIDLLTRKWAWPQLRYALWSLILVKLLLPPSLSLPSGIVPELRPVVGQVVRWLDSEKPAVGARPAAISDFGFGIADSALSVNPQFKGFTMSTGGVVKIEDLGDGSPVARPSWPCSFLLDARAGRPRHEENHRQASLDDATQRVNTDSMVAANPQPAIRNPQLEWQFYAMTIWLLGTSILGIWLFLRLHSVAGRQGYRAAAASLPQSFYNHLADCATRLGLRRIPRVAVTKRLTSPAVFGVFSPVLLVPKGYLSKLSRRDTEHMLLHELAHIKRGDLVMHGLYLLLQIVYWYNPLLWLVRRHMHHLRELSCDGTVAELLRERTVAYRQTLLETARRLLATSAEPGLGLLGLFEDSNRLLVRLNWLTKPTWRHKTMKRVTVAIIAALMFACVLPMAQAQEAASKEQTPTVVREGNQQSQDQVSQDIAALQARLEQLVAQQQELQNQLRALAEQRNQLRADRREPAVRREATRGRPQREQAPGDVTAAPPEAPAPQGAREWVAPEAREQLKRAQAESRRDQAQDQGKQDWAKTMRAYGEQMQPGGRGRPGQPFGGGQGRGRDPQSQMGPQQPSTPGQPPAGSPGPDGGRSWNRRTPPPEQMSDQADANKDSNRPQRGNGPGDQMQPRGRGRPGQPFGGGQGRGRNPQSQMGPQQPSTPGQPPAGSPGPDGGRSWNRRTPPPEQMSDQADANKDDALTREEIKAFEDARRGNQPFRQR
jgi:beta-lactamase regulating signal transducer with metallopeptidase domain